MTCDRASVLLVDDRPENLLTLEAALSDLDVDLVRATSGPEALKQVLDRQFAVVLLDVQMPEMDGFETARLIRQRERSRDTPIIFLTADERAPTQVFDVYAAGAVDFLVKPVVPQILKAKVSTFVALHRQALALQAEVRQRVQAEQALRAAAQQREQAEAEVRRLNQELEARVTRRTAELQRVRDRLHFLAEASALLGSSLDYEVTLQNVARLAVSCCADFCVIDVLEHDGLLRRVAVAHADPVQEEQFGPLLRQHTPNRDRGMIAEALREGRSFLVPEVTEAWMEAVATSEAHRGLMQDLGVRSVMLVPLQARGRTLGLLVFGSTEEGHRYGTEDLAVAEALAHRAGLALDNARLYQEARTSGERLLRLTEASATLLPGGEGRSIVSAVLDLAQRLIPADALALWRQEEPHGWTMVAQANLSAGCPAALSPSADRLSAEAVCIEDVEAWSGPEERREAYRAEGIRSLLHTPLRLHGELTGTLTFYYRRPYPFEEGEVRVATALANLAASAITTGELYTEQRRMRNAAEAAQEQLRFLAEASTVLASSLDYRTTLEHVAQLAVQSLADWCTVHLVEEDGNVRQVALAHVDPEKVKWGRALGELYPYDPDQPRGVAHVLRSGQTEIYPEITDDLLVQTARDPEHLELLRKVGFTSCVIAPLRIRDQVLGAISFIASESGKRYDAAGVALAEDLARRAATAIDHARLFRQAEEALRQREETLALLDTLFASAPVALAFLDTDLRYVRVNEALAGMHGKRPEEIVGRTLHEMVPTMAAMLEPLYRRVMESGAPLLNLEVSGETSAAPGEQCHWLVNYYPVRNPQGQVLGVGAAAVEMTDRIRVRQALQASEARLGGIIGSAMDAIITVDARHRITLFNAAAERMFRCSAASALGEPVERFIPERFRRMHAGHVMAFEEKGETSRSLRSLGTLTALRADGEEFPIEAAISQVEVGGERFFTVILRDVTDRLALEAELRERVKDLALAAQRKDEFLAMLAHELRNPLGAISNALHVIQQPHAPEAARQRALQVFQRQIGHQSRMVDDLLDVSRLTRGLVEIRSERLDLVSLVRDTAEDYRESLDREGLGFSLDLPVRTLWVEGDPTRLSQVLGNLMSNAMKFTQTGGHVAVSVEEDREADRVTVRVRDTGEGLTADFLPYAFAAFAQADRSLARSRGGLGLGLAIVKGLIELHGGEVGVSSAGPGCGAEFWFSLPLVSRGIDLPPARLTASPGGGLRILVVEDNRDAAETLRDLLEMYGYAVEIALTGHAGLQLAREWQPDVVLCDIGLPGMDGHEVARSLRQAGNPPLRRLIAVTGYGGAEDQVRSREAGFDHHLVKPLNPEELKQVLDNVAVDG